MAFKIFISKANVLKGYIYFVHHTVLFFSINFPQLIPTVHQPKALRKTLAPNFLHLKKSWIYPFPDLNFPGEASHCALKVSAEPRSDKEGEASPQVGGLRSAARSGLLTAGNPRGAHLGLQTLPRGNSWTNFKVMAHIPWQGRAQIFLACMNCWEPLESLVLLRMTN